MVGAGEGRVQASGTYELGVFLHILSCAFKHKWSIMHVHSSAGNRWAVLTQWRDECFDQTFRTSDLTAGEGFGQETPAECADVPIQVSLEPASTRHV
jgi:hypothetical protein